MRDEEFGDLGPCCCCEKNIEGGDFHINIVMLNKKAPVPGTGWGCVICKIPSDGAMYVCCDECLRAEREPKFVIDGYAREKRRKPIEELSDEPFGHEDKFHSTVAFPVIDVAVEKKN